MFVIPIRRAVSADVVDLMKARQGAPRAGHKYIKREPYFSQGRLKWRYYYADDLQRKESKPHLDPDDTHEHYLLGEMKHIHENLKGRLPTASESTIDKVKSFFQSGKVKILASTQFMAKRVAPYVEREKKGEDVERDAPLARIVKALEMVPKNIMDMVEPDLTEIEFREPQSMSEFGARAFVHILKRNLVMLDNTTFDEPRGDYTFKSPGNATGTETTFWHELGHHVHLKWEGDKDSNWDDWKKIHAGNEPKISAYACTNAYEDFAETFACAIGHPKELFKTCPERYAFMRKHLLHDMPDPKTLETLSDEELSWWKGHAQTIASKILRLLKGREPAQRFHAYYSDQDQFFTVAKGGRTLYFRYGPATKEDEGSWKKINSILDPVTGLPRYDEEAGMFFRSTTFLKEIYDEHGNPLTDRQAYFYLTQGDPESEKTLEDLKGKEDTYLDWAEAREGKDTHTLSYRLYSLLGRSGNTPEKERERVEKEKKKGRSGYMGRHDYAPVEIGAQEFFEKSGTFKLGNMKAAPMDRQIWRAVETDLKTGKRRPLTMIDPVSGEPVPALRARVYEQENFDGTWSRVEVNESAPFLPGQTIEVPAGSEGWKKWTIPEGFDASPSRIAREFGTTARNILERNARFTRGQIMNPILAALINPMGKPIEDEATLRQLMRKAAEGDPPARAWVTIRGSDSLDSASAHLQVEFDGQGSPRVLGDYWKKLVGKDDLRIDDLLDENNNFKFKIPKVVEKPRVKLPVQSGNNVWFVDPRTKKRVMGTLIKTATGEDGKLVYTVEPYGKQGAGVSKTQVAVSKVDAAYNDEVPGKTTRRRYIEPLDSQLLLYADQVRPGSGPYDTSGIVRIALPKDGSIVWDQLSRIPGIQFEYADDGKKRGGEGGETERAIIGATVSLNDFPDFREKLGGFVMDERVQNMLRERMNAQRLLQSQTKTFLKDEDFEDADGNVNPNGVLRGLVVGRQGIQPGAHRIDALKKIAANGGRMLAAHFMGTGKTALGIMASQMMRNLTDPGNPEKAHPSRVTKKVITIVPLNTAQNWFQEYKQFTGAPPTLIGASTLAGAQQIFNLKNVERKANESDDAYYARAIEAWKKECESNPKLWNPWADDNANVCVPFEYFRDNEALMRATKLFDGMVVDEAHKIFRENEISNAIERWNPDMKMFLMLTGTPVTNTLKILPRMVHLVTAGKVSLGTPQEFEDRYLIESQVMRAAGAKNPPKTDLNPQRVGELAAKLQPIIHVATIADVKGKTMPSVLLDENEPAHMIGQQKLLYRAAMAALTDEDRSALETSGAMGIDENSLLSEEGRRRVSVARSIANSPGYKAPDQQEYVTYEVTKEAPGEEEKKGHGRKEKKKEKVVVQFMLPDHRQLTAKQPEGWGGRWPSWDWVEKGYMSEGELKAWEAHMDKALGRTFDSIAGQKIDPEILDALKKNGTWRSPTGVEWPGKLKNPDYGPEGVVSRGVYDESTGEVKPIKRQFFNSTTGDWEEIEVPVGKRFIRDPNKKAAALYYDDADWDSTGRFVDNGEGADDPGLDGDDDDDESPAPKKGGKNEQKPKAGREEFNINRHPAMRKQRAMFDLALTTGNAKTAKLEETMKNVLSEKTGQGAKSQMIMFGNRVGSSVRCMESKLRTMGYMDVNEALGHPDWSSDHDKVRGQQTRKFFVTYMGKGATLGDRDINSEIFRRQQDEFGKDTGVSMFVWRSIYGQGRKLPADGEIREGWSRAERKRIAQNFVDSHKVGKDGKPAPLEVPMRVMGAQLKDGSLGQKYLYESDMKPADKRLAEQLEIKLRASVGEEAKKVERELATVFKPYWSERVPLSPGQMDVFNNCEVMVASDAANVGLNWPANHLIMYDSLFSPMDEWQRISRAARMLPDVISKDLKPVVDEIDKHIKAIEAANSLKEFESFDGALTVVNEAIAMLPPEMKTKLNDIPGGAPDQIVEAYFAKRALNKISSLRAETEDRLRKEGAVPDPNKKAGPDNYIHPKAIIASDVVNEILRKHVTPFEREMLKARRYLVDVKRLTVSADVPQMRRVKGKGRVPVVDENGNVVYTTESPVQAERAQLMQGRAKMVPYEYALNMIQNAEAKPTRYDMIGTDPQQLAELSLLPKQHLDRKAKDVKKSMRFVLFDPNRRLRG